MTARLFSDGTMRDARVRANGLLEIMTERHRRLHGDKASCFDSLGGSRR
jgi:hypothetical protein